MRLKEEIVKAPDPLELVKLQVQTLINQRVLGAPTEQKETTFNYVMQDTPDIEPEKEKRKRSV